MPRSPRSALPDGTFHVVVRGVARSAIFRDDDDYATFRAQLLRVAEKFAWIIHAYCLTPNHYHLIVETTQENLSRGMHRLNGGYAQGFNARYDRSGHVFQNRFTSYMIDNEEYFEHALAYLHANPVEAGLCDDGDAWPWKD
jgi:REP element-mobilizing transposase RayT